MGQNWSKFHLHVWGPEITGTASPRAERVEGEARLHIVSGGGTPSKSRNFFTYIFGFLNFWSIFKKGRQLTFMGYGSKGPAAHPSTSMY